MRNLITLLTMVLIVGSTAVAQTGILPLTSDAARYYQAQQYDLAKDHIDRSIAGAGAQDAYTWQVKGHIYKEIFKQVENFDVNSKSREIAVESFFKCLELDEENKYLEWNSTSLRFLASTYWNDAVSIMEQKDRGQLGQAEVFFNRYIEIMRKARPSENLDGFSLDFYKAYATANRKVIETMRALKVDPDEYAVELERVETSYTLARKLDARDYGANYNHAINLYNEAAYKIGQLDPEAELTEVVFIEIGCKEIFKRALPIAQTAEELRPGRIEILKALRAIHLSLNNYDEFDRYNKLVREKQGELIIDEDVQHKLDRKFFKDQRVDD